MKRFNRKHLLRTGAGGAVAGLALGAPGLAKAQSDDDGLFVHIDGVVMGTEGTFKLDIDVAGTRTDLRGEGSDTDPAEDPASFCIYAQSGRIRRHTVELQGRIQIANNESFEGLEVTTQANMRTGRIDWTFGPFAFAGSGRVIVAEAEVHPG